MARALWCLISSRNFQLGKFEPNKQVVDLLNKFTKANKGMIGLHLHTGMACCGVTYTPLSLFLSFTQKGSNIKFSSWCILHVMSNL